MFRKSALAVAMFGALASSSVVALGLGEIELKSSLNQPLNAEVELLSASATELQELKVSVASAEAFANAGIDRPMFLNKLDFTVLNNAAGKPVVRITSRDVVREPFLDFLLEMSWSKGRLVREYTVLVDPPVTMPAQAPVTAAPASRAAAAGSTAVAAPAGQVRHAAQMPPVSVSPGQYGPTRRNDTLWSIAEAVRPDAGVSVEQTMMGILRANPEAFTDNNINNLKAGYVLRIPDRQELTSITRSEAVREARAQYAAWNAARGQAPGEPTQAGTLADSAAAGPSAGATAIAGEPSLELVAPVATDEATGTQGREGLQVVQQELMMANEALEEQRRQSEEMSGRLSMLEEQIANMQRLIQLKDNELARLQAVSAGESVDAVPVETSAEAVPSESFVDTAPVTGEDAESLAGMPVEAGPLTGAPMEPGDVVPGDELPMAASEDIPMDQASALSGAEDAGVSEMAGVSDIDELADTEAGGEPGSDAIAAVDVEAEPVTAPVEQPSMMDNLSMPAFVEKLLAKPEWLGGGAAVLGLLAFFGLRRKRGVESEFQESILQAVTQKESAESDSAIMASQPESTNSKSTESSLLSEFAVSDMGAIRNDGEADPLAEADVYLAYGRFRQAEELIKDALDKDSERSDLNLKLLEVFMACKNQAAFDAHAQGMLARLENADDPVWEKIAEMGRELSPDNPLYRPGAAHSPDAAGAADDDTEFYPGSATGEAPDGAQGLDFDMDLSFDPRAEADQPDSVEFTPPEIQEQPDDASEPRLNVAMDSVEPDVVATDKAPEFDLEDFDMEVDGAADEEFQGDGELTELDEVSTKLDLARAYIDMGDPDGARSILDEVMEEGSDHQKTEAQDIMAQLS